MKENGKIRSYKQEGLFLWGIFFIINTIVALYGIVPTIVPDEINPLGIPAFLTGADWSSAISYYKNYYGFGQAILYTPLFMLIKDNVLLYKAIIVLNGALVSFIPVIANSIEKKFFNIYDKKIRILIACVIGAQPCYLTLSKRAWNETLLMLLFWIICYLVLLCLVSADKKIKNILYSVILSIALCYGYATHGRFIAIIVSVLITSLLYFLITKKKIISLVPFVIAFVISNFINNLVKSFFLHNVWLVSSESELRNTFAETANRALSNMFSIDTLHLYLRAFSGYLFYIFIASIGLVVLGFILYCKFIKKYISKQLNSDNGNEILFFGGFSFVSLFCALGVAIVFFTTDLLDSTGYYFIYGRYTEYLVAPILLLTLILVYNFKMTRLDLLLSGLIFIIHSIYTFLIEAIDITSGKYEVVPLNIFTLNSFAYNNNVSSSKLAFLSAILVAIIFFGISIFLLYRNKYKTSLFIIFTIYILSYAHTSIRLLIPNSYDIYHNLDTSYKFFNSIDISESYRRVYLFELYPQGYQFALRDYDFHPVFGEVTDLEKNSFMVTNVDINNNYNYDYNQLYEIILKNKANNESIYVYGKELANELLKQKVELKRCAYNLGTIIDLTQNDSISIYKKNGWYNQEEWGIWTQGNESVLQFYLEEVPTSDLILNFKIGTYNGPKNVELYVNDNYVSTIVFSEEPKDYSIIIPIQYIMDSSYINIKFKIIDELVSPQELGVSEDSRKLGLGLYNISIN